MAGSTGRRSTSSNRKSTKAGSKKKQTTVSQAQQDGALFHEIGLIVLFVAMVILFCCNFGLIGPAGDAVSGFLFGLFGFTAYIVPILLFLAAAFWFANEGNGNALRKLIAGIVLFFMLGVVCDLIAKGAASLEKYDFVAIYENSRVGKSGGGILAGSLSFLLQHYLETIGAVLVVLLCCVVCLILLTEKSLLSSMKKSGSRMRELSREEARRRREMNQMRHREQEEVRARKEEERARRDAKRRLRAEEKENEKILRMEKKVSGVMLDTALARPEEGSHRDDIHEIVLDGQEEVLPGMDMEEGDYLEEPGEPAFGFERIQIRSVHQVSVDPGMATEPEMLDPMAFPGPEPYDGTGDFVDADMYADMDGTMEADGFADGGISVDQGIFLDPDMYMNTGIPAQTDGPAEADIANGSGAYVDAFYDQEEVGLSDPESAGVYGEESSRDPEQFPEPDALPSAGIPPVEDAIDLTGQAIRIHKEGSSEPAGKTERCGHPAVGNGQVEGTQEKVGSTPEQSMSGGNGQGVVKKPMEYRLPPLSRLQKGEPVAADTTRELKETAMRLQQTLATFGVRVTITDISQGPSVTRYELQPEQGVKVSKIVGLTDDIKLNLAATDIRIEAPIPGKAAIGIEVPNKETMMVALRDLLESPEFQNFPSNIAFAVGKDIAGKVVVTDIAKMPHMLIAGATGSGKSVCINTLIMSILYKAHPDDVKLIMVDPKVVELSIYNGIPHLLVPVVTDPKKASAALHWGVSEMEERYRKFADFNVRDLKGYNKKVESMGGSGDGQAPAKMPQIVIIVDELADLMMVCPGEVEESICRLAQLARAAGIHLIIATQRPSVDVITGLIKANMPSRVAFSVSSGVDSRTILDMNGAEKLLGKGDMLFYPQGFSKPARVQGAFVSDMEVSDVVDFLKNQTLGNTYAEDVEEKIQHMDTSAGSFSAGGGSELDDLFEKAGRFIIDKDKASIGMLQRVLKVGFNRAARIMDQLCDLGVVGEEEGTKPRKILMSPEQFEQLLEEI